MDGAKIDKLTKGNRNNGSQIYAVYVYMGELMMGTDIYGNVSNSIQETDFSTNLN